MNDVTLTSSPLMILLSFSRSGLNDPDASPPSLNKLADAAGAEDTSNQWEIRQALAIDDRAGGILTYLIDTTETRSDQRVSPP